MSVQQFELDKNRFGEVRKMIVVRGLPMMVLAMVAGGWMSYYSSSRQDAPYFWFIMIPLFLVLLGAGMYRGIQRQKNFSLATASLLMSRESHGSKPIRPLFGSLVRKCRKYIKMLMAVTL